MITGLYVPIYGDLTTETNAILAAKQAHPSVPIVAAVNPNSGVGTALRVDVQTAMLKLQQAGVKVLGYIYTNYGSRPVADVEHEADLYRQWYNVDGLMLDEMSSGAASAPYYRGITEYAHARNESFVMGNPGNPVPVDLLGTVDCLFIYEGQGVPSITQLRLATFSGQYPKSNFAVAAYGVSAIDTSWLADAQGMVGWLYLANGLLPNPYAALPPYLNTLAGDLQQ